MKKLTRKRKAAREKRYQKRITAGLYHWISQTTTRYHVGNFLMWDLQRTDPLFDPKYGFVGKGDDSIIKILDKEVNPK